MTKLDMRTPDFTNENIAQIAALFPNCLTEAKDEKGNIKKAIDFDLLKQELSANIVDGTKERYTLNWPGKKEALVKANEPINKTLRPCEEESVNFDTTQNLYIEGDNLEALKLLQESYLGKIKMIYIDPPYNTGKDFVYKDNFTGDKDEELEASGQKDEEGGRLVANPDSNGRYHSDWLTMMYPRLKLARNLLKDDGVIFISIGDDEVSNIEKIANEIFGEDNKIGFITRVQKRGSDLGTYFSPTSDYILAYAKNQLNLNGFKIGINESQFQKIEEYGDRKGELYEDSKSLYQSSLSDIRKGQKYFIECPDGSKVIPPCEILDEVQREGEKRWRWSKDRYLKDKHLLVFKKTKSSPLLDEYGNQSKWNVYTKRYLRDAQEKGNVPPNLFTEFLNSKATSTLKTLDMNFSFSKPKELISYLIEIIGIKDEIVLDFFSGSATTAHSVLEFNAKKNKSNKFLLVQLAENIDGSSIVDKSLYKNICEIGKERIRRASKKILEENKDKEGIENLDIGFRVLKIDSSNMKDVYYKADEINQKNLFDTVDNIKEGRSAEDLLFQVLLDWGVDLMLPIRKEDVVGHKVFFVDNDALATCFEENLDEEFITALAKKEILRVVFKDSGFANDDIRINVEQIFKQYSPDTEVKVI